MPTLQNFADHDWNLFIPSSPNEMPTPEKSLTIPKRRQNAEGAVIPSVTVVTEDQLKFMKAHPAIGGDGGWFSRDASGQQGLVIVTDKEATAPTPAVRK